MHPSFDFSLLSPEQFQGLQAYLGSLTSQLGGNGAPVTAGNPELGESGASGAISGPGAVVGENGGASELGGVKGEQGAAEEAGGELDKELPEQEDDGGAGVVPEQTFHIPGVTPGAKRMMYGHPLTAEQRQRLEDNENAERIRKEKERFQEAKRREEIRQEKALRDTEEYHRKKKEEEERKKKEQEELKKAKKEKADKVKAEKAKAEKAKAEAEAEKAKAEKAKAEAEKVKGEKAKAEKARLILDYVEVPPVRKSAPEIPRICVNCTKTGKECLPPPPHTKGNACHYCAQKHISCRFEDGEGFKRTTPRAAKVTFTGKRERELAETQAGPSKKRKVESEMAEDTGVVAALKEIAKELRLVRSEIQGLRADMGKGKGRALDFDELDEDEYEEDEYEEEE